jgi:SDA1.
MRNFFPIDMINNPQDFCDKLFAQLKKKNFKFEATLAMMAVLGRMIGRHKLIVLNFYPFMMKYMFPHQKEIAKILAYVAESCHELTPPDELETVLKHLIDNFVNERVNDDKITMGLRTIREMSEKAPTFMDEFSLNYCAEFKNYKEKNVAAAARSLINYFRDVNPDLLSKKFRGRFDFLDKKSERKTYMYGELKINERVDGAELLQPGILYIENYSNIVRRRCSY